MLKCFAVEGIPPADLREWKKRKAIEAGVSENAAEAAAHIQKSRVDLGVIPQDELRKKLAAHKDLMEGRIAPSAILGGAPPGMPPPPFSMPPPSMMSG